MSRRKKKDFCGCLEKRVHHDGCKCDDRRSNFDNIIVDPGTCIEPFNKREVRGRSFRGPLFPNSIRDLLILLAEEDSENLVTVIIDGGFGEESILEDIRIIAVLDNTLVAQCDDLFRFIDICCICQVIVDCQTILEEILERHSLGRS